MWQSIKNNVTEAAKESLGGTKGGAMHDKEAWQQEKEIKDILRGKKSLYKKWQQERSQEEREKYREVRNTAKKVVAEKKNGMSDKFYQDMRKTQGKNRYMKQLESRPGTQAI